MEQMENQDKQVKESTPPENAHTPAQEVLSVEAARERVMSHGGHGDPMDLSPEFLSHLSRLADPDRHGWVNQGELCWLKQGNMPWWPCQVVPAPAGQQVRPEWIWVFNFG